MQKGLAYYSGGQCCFETTDFTNVTVLHISKTYQMIILNEFPLW